MRTGWRIAAVVALALYGFAATLPDAVILWQPVGTYGLTTDVEGGVRSVSADSPASRAGILAGDRIAGLSVAPTPEVWVSKPGVSRTVVVTHAGVERRVTLTAQPTSLPAGGRVMYPLRKILGAIFIAAGIFLVLARPNLATWGFFLYCVGANPFEGWYLLGAAMEPTAYLISSLLADVMNAAGIVGLLAFALNFPHSGIAPWRARAQRFLPLLFAFTAALNLGVDLAAWFARPPQWFVNCQEIWFDVLFLATAGIFGETYARTRGEDRERVAWTSFGTILGMIGLAVADIYGLFTWPVFSGAGWVERLLAMLVGAVPIAIMYAAIRHHVFDFSLAVNRALVYGAMTALVVAAFAVLHSFAVRTLINAKLSVVVELLAAIAIGFWLQAIHKRVSTLIDTVFFRERLRAHRRLQSAAYAVESAATAAAADEILAREPFQAMALDSSAVFRVDDDPMTEERRHGALIRRHAFGWEDARLSVLAAGDMLVLHLRAQRKPLRLADLNWAPAGLPQGVRTPQYAVPILSGHHVTGVALYGVHRSGNDLDPDDVAMLAMLARTAGQAYDRLEAEALRRLVRTRLSGGWQVAPS